MSDDLSHILANLPSYQPGSTNYQQLMATIEEIGRDLKASYTFNKVSTERLKKNLMNARILVRGCLVDADADKKKADIEIEKQRQLQAKQDKEKEKEKTSTPTPSSTPKPQ